MSRRDVPLALVLFLHEDLGLTIHFLGGHLIIIIDESFGPNEALSVFGISGCSKDFVDGLSRMQGSGELRRVDRNGRETGTVHRSSLKIFRILSVSFTRRSARLFDRESRPGMADGSEHRRDQVQ
jgi:hypothetical protein